MLRRRVALLALLALPLRRHWRCRAFVWSGASTIRHTVSTKGTWRVYDVLVSVEADEDSTASLRKACGKRLERALKRAPRFSINRVVRKSLDTRKKLPVWSYVVEISAEKEMKEIRGIVEKSPDREERRVIGSARVDSRQKGSAIVVGCGPAGIFCALELASRGVFVTLLERGEPVEQRGADIGRLIHRRQLNLESNFCFGEGGAGTWSDGKLTTRVGRNAADVRDVLATLVQHGASETILTAGAPHLGTDSLVRILKSVRSRLVDLGVDIEFGCRVRGFEVVDGECRGVFVEKGTLRADAVVVATGHSSDEMYVALRDAGAALAVKPLAVGFRVEHPQSFVNRATYGESLADRAIVANRRRRLEGEKTLPVASYRLAAEAEGRSAYSFCMCPGGQIVPAATKPDLMVVNGMSFSRRNSKFANAALVVSVASDDPVLEPYSSDGPMKALSFQRDLERRAAILGGGDFTCPVHRLDDFVRDRPPRKRTGDSARLDSSYRLGVKEADCRTILPPELSEALATAAQDHFERKMPGFIEHGLLHAVETRTSSPIQVTRSNVTLQSTTLKHLFPCGEGAGYAGGIVSAALDGIRVARAVQDSISSSEAERER